MKKIFTSLVCFLICKTLPAQVLIALVFGSKLQTDKLGFGLMVSPTFSTISELESKERFGVGLGLYFDFKLSENLFFHPELGAKPAFGAAGLAPYPIGNDSLDAIFANGSVERKLKAFSMPLLMRYRLHQRLFIEAGPEVDMHLKIKDEFTVKENGGELTYTKISKEGFTRFGVGFAAGLMYKLKHDKGLGFGIRYYAGLTDALKIEGNQRNAAFLFNVAIPVGLKAEMERKKEEQ